MATYAFESLPVGSGALRGRPLFYFIALSLLALSNFAPAATVVFVRSSDTPSPEQYQLEIAAKFYGVNLALIDPNKSDLNRSLDAVVVQRETVAVAIEAKVLGLVNQSTLMRALRRTASRNIPLLVLGVTPETDSNVLKRWSGGAVIGAKSLGGVLHYRVGADASMAQQLANLELPFPGRSTFYLDVSEKSQAQVVMSFENDHDVFPSFVEVDVQHQKVLLLSTTFPSGDHEPTLDSGDTVGAFTRVAPFLMFVRHCAGEQGWHSPRHYANLTIDDPWLREPYGYLDYKALLQEMEKHDFHTTIAFIPWNYDRSSPDVVSLFRNHPDRFSICLHGNNHDHDEFTEPHSDKVADIEQALARMDRFHSMTDVPYDRVMVFPHNIGSGDLLQELKKYNFLATINSSNVPIDESKPTDVLSALRLVTLAYANFPSITRYPADMADLTVFVAVNDFLDNPLFFYSHHGLFAAGSGAFDHTADVVNRIEPATRWRNVGEIARHLYLMRQRSDANYDVMVFSSSIELDNPAARDRIFHISKQESQPGSLASVNVNGHPVLFEINGVNIQLGVPVARGGTSRIDIVYKNAFQPSAVSTTKNSFRVYSLRMASDFRDIALSNVPLGTAFTASYYKAKLTPSFLILLGAGLVGFGTYGGWCVSVILRRKKRKQATRDVIAGEQRKCA